MLVRNLFEHAKLLFVSASAAFETRIRELLQKEGAVDLLCVPSLREAKHVLIEQDIDLLILDAPLPGENTLSFVMEVARSKFSEYSIILLSSAALYEKQNLYETERMGIVTFKKPIDPQILLQTMRLLLSMHLKIKTLESKADQLRQKLEDDHLVSRAKILLVAKENMSEEAAHHYIEKKAMDTCVKKTVVAAEVIRVYEDT